MEELRLLAERDALTGLPNTRAFERSRQSVGGGAGRLRPALFKRR